MQVAATALNVAVTLFAEFIVTEQLLPLTVSHPDQPANDEPAVAVAVMTTVEATVDIPLHAPPPQIIPAELLVSVPLPEPLDAAAS